MARCRCENTSCPCQLVAGSGTKITGSGATDDPFIISVPLASTTLAFTDSGDIDFTVSGTGTPTDPLMDTAVSKCISCAGGAPGDVLTKQADGSYLPMPVSAPAGAVFADQVEIVGQGTSGSPFTLAPIDSYGALKALGA